MWQLANEYRRTSAALFRLFTIQLLLLTDSKWKLMRRFCLRFVLCWFGFSLCCNVLLCEKEAKILSLQNNTKASSLIQYGCSYYIRLSTTPTKRKKKEYICSWKPYWSKFIFYRLFFFGDCISNFHHCSIEHIRIRKYFTLLHLHNDFSILFVSWYEQIHRIVHWILILALYLSRKKRTNWWKYAMYLTQCDRNCFGWTPNQTFYCVWEMKLECVAKKLVWELLWLALYCTICWGWYSVFYSNRTNGTE